MVFPGVAKRIFPGEAKSFEISFCLLDTKKITFFAKNFIENCQFQNSGGGQSPLSPSRRTWSGI